MLLCSTSLDMNMHHQVWNDFYGVIPSCRLVCMKLKCSIDVQWLLLQYGSSYQDQVPKLQAEVGMLKWNNTLLLTQLARAVKCLNAVSAENELLRTEVASLLPSRACQVRSVPWVSLLVVIENACAVIVMRRMHSDDFLGFSLDAPATEDHQPKIPYRSSTRGRALWDICALWMKPPAWPNA